MRYATLLRQVTYQCLCFFACIAYILRERAHEPLYWSQINNSFNVIYVDILRFLTPTRDRAMNKIIQRRAIVASLAASPIWIKPVIKQVMLPAHAATTDGSDSGSTTLTLTNTSFYTQPPTYTASDSTGGSGNSLLDAFIPPAMAVSGPGDDLGMLITLSEVNSKVVAESRHINLKRDRLFTASGIPTDNTATSLSNSDSCGSPNLEHTHIKIVGYSYNDDSVSVEITTTSGNRPTRTQTVPLGSGPIDIECNEH